MDIQYGDYKSEIKVIDADGEEVVNFTSSREDIVNRIVESTGLIGAMQKGRTMTIKLSPSTRVSDEKDDLITPEDTLGIGC